MVVAEWDAALRPELAEPMKGLVDDLEVGDHPAVRPLDAAGAPRRAEPHPRRVAPAAFRLGVPARYDGPCIHSATPPCREQEPLCLVPCQ